MVSSNVGSIERRASGSHVDGNEASPPKQEVSVVVDLENFRRPHSEEEDAAAEADIASHAFEGTAADAILLQGVAELTRICRMHRRSNIDEDVIAERVQYTTNWPTGATMPMPLVTRWRACGAQEPAVYETGSILVLRTNLVRTTPSTPSTILQKALCQSVLELKIYCRELSHLPPSRRCIYRVARNGDPWNINNLTLSHRCIPRQAASPYNDKYSTKEILRT